MKYVAFTADTEAYFCPPSFESWQGVFTMDIVRVCQEKGVPFTWLVICDRERDPREFREIDAMMKTVWPARKDVDEFGIHVHLKWFINDSPDDDESFKLPERRLAFMKAALARRGELGMAAPASFRYGGGDMQAKFYRVEDLELLHSSGVRNFLFPHELSDFQGLEDIEHCGNGVWRARDMTDITVFRGPRSSMELDTSEMIARMDAGLAESDYITVSCHDYTAAVPGNLAAAVDHLRDACECEIVTVSRIGELIRSGEVNNEF